MIWNSNKKISLFGVNTNSELGVDHERANNSISCRPKTNNRYYNFPFFETIDTIKLKINLH